MFNVTLHLDFFIQMLFDMHLWTQSNSVYVCVWVWLSCHCSWKHWGLSTPIKTDNASLLQIEGKGFHFSHPVTNTELMHRRIDRIWSFKLYDA